MDLLKNALTIEEVLFITRVQRKVLHDKEDRKKRKYHRLWTKKNPDKVIANRIKHRNKRAGA